MKRFGRAILVASMIGAIYFQPRPAIGADDDTIDTVSSDGSTIIMQSGQTYESDDPATSSTWNSGDDVTITNSDKIINRDDGGESVEGTEE